MWIYEILQKIKYNIIDNEKNLEQGDILIMHQHLVHSPTLNDINSKVRMTFNLSTKCVFPYHLLFIAIYKIN